MRHIMPHRNNIGAKRRSCKSFLPSLRRCLLKRPAGWRATASQAATFMHGFSMLTFQRPILVVEDTSKGDTRYAN
jgi:hypothetical protein